MSDSVPVWGIFLPAFQSASILIPCEYGIRESLIYRWKKEYGKIGSTEKGETVTVAEYRRLQKKLAQVEMENEILKKATAIFARNQD